MGPPQNLQIVPFTLPIVQVIQFALLAAVLLLVADIEASTSSSVIFSAQEDEAQVVEMVEPITCIPPTSSEIELPPDPFSQSSSASLPSLKKTRKSKVKAVALVDR